jgi:hypothetical protein
LRPIQRRNFCNGTKPNPVLRHKIHCACKSFC